MNLAQTVAHVAAAVLMVPVAAQVKVASVLRALKEAPEDEKIGGYIIDFMYFICCSTILINDLINEFKFLIDRNILNFFILNLTI